MQTIHSKTILFITGAFLHHSCWDNWQRFYLNLGYQTFAPPWPNKDAPAADLRSRHPDRTVAAMRLDLLVGYFEDFARSLPEKPILIGHSIGGLVAQILNAKGLASAVVALHSVPPQGIFTFKLSFLVAGWGPLGFFTDPDESFLMTFRQWQYGFANGMAEAEQQQGYLDFAVPESKRIVRDTVTAAAKLDFTKPAAPLLFVAGTADHTIPASLNRDNFKRYRRGSAKADLVEFSSNNHFVLQQQGWQQVALYAHKWLTGAERPQSIQYS